MALNSFKKESKRLKHQIMNIDKTIKELTNRLDEVHPYFTSSITNCQNKNDGITYWKDKKIISTNAWKDLYQQTQHIQILTKLY